MIVTDPEILRIEQVLASRFQDPSFRLLFNERSKRWVVSQDLRLCKDRIDPWHITEPMLVGVPGIGEKTIYNPLFEIAYPDAEHISMILFHSSMPKRDKEAWANMDEQKAKIESDKETRRKERIQDMMSYAKNRMSGRVVSYGR